MVKLTVYGSDKATCTQRVLILLEELSLEYKLHSVDLMKNQQKDPRFLALNPFGKVPVIKYGDKTLFESRSILRYIAKNNNNDLDLTLDNDVNVDIWMEVESNSFGPIISKIVYEKVFKPMRNQESDFDIINVELNKFKDILKIYDERLLTQKYIASNEYSIADICHIPYMNYFVNADKEYKKFLKNYPNVYKWFKRIMNRKYVQRILNPETIE